MLKKLAAQTAIYGISSIIARFLNYLLTPYLTRIMTTGEYGVVTDLYALIPFIRFHLIVLTSFVGGDGLCRNSVVSIIDGKYYNRRCCDGLTIR